MRFESTDNPEGMVKLLRHAEGSTVTVRDVDGCEWQGDVDRVLFDDCDANHLDKGNLSVSFLFEGLEVEGEQPWHGDMTPSLRTTQEKFAEEWRSVEAVYPVEEAYPEAEADADVAEIDWVAIDVDDPPVDGTVFIADPFADELYGISPDEGSEHPIIAGVSGEAVDDGAVRRIPVDAFITPDGWGDDVELVAERIVGDEQASGDWRVYVSDGSREMSVGRVWFQNRHLVDDEYRRVARYVEADEESDEKWSVRTKSVRRLMWMDAVLRARGDHLNSVVDGAEYGDDVSEMVSTASANELAEFWNQNAWAVVRDAGEYEWPESGRANRDYRLAVEYFWGDNDE